MIKYTSLFLSGLLLITSCKNKDNKEEHIIRKWQAVKLENPEMDQKLREQSNFIDTFGTHTDAATNMQLYGVAQVSDSMRQSLKAELNQLKTMQEASVKNTSFHFRKDGIAVLNFSGQNDSVNWYLSSAKDTLVLDEKKLKGKGNIIRMKIHQLSGDSLKLQFIEEGLTSTVTFAPSEK